jgi:hypothetical protein
VRPYKASDSASAILFFVGQSLKVVPVWTAELSELTRTDPQRDGFKAVYKVLSGLFTATNKSSAAGEGEEEGENIVRLTHYCILYSILYLVSVLHIHDKFYRISVYSRQIFVTTHSATYNSCRMVGRIWVYRRSNQGDLILLDHIPLELQEFPLRAVKIDIFDTLFIWMHINNIASIRMCILI